MNDHELFHEGELALQEHVGAREQLAEMGRRMMRAALPDAHRQLLAGLPFVLVGSVGDHGQPYASVLAGPPGFMRSDDARTLVIEAKPHAPDPLAATLQLGARVGLLAIEPQLRRRIRVNGVVSELRAGGFSVAVRQSFGNCPKYIQARAVAWDAREQPARLAAFRCHQLTAETRRMVLAADTFYIASAYPSARGAPADDEPAHGVDMSHRGGKPGFVRVERDGDGTDLLTVPDFSGNAMFATLGNIARNPRAGLLFIDYERGDLLQLAVSAEIVFDGLELARFEGAERLLRLRVHEALHLQRALPLRWSAAELSPFLLDTGTWAER